MQISMGILAYNESLAIGSMLSSLFEQTLWQEANPELKIELIVVPNGCTDDTASVARNNLAKLSQPLVEIDFSWRVFSVKQQGKSNAWNVYVHQLASPSADYLFLMDSDIKLLDRCTLTSMIEILENRPEASVAVDKPIKDISLKPNKNIIETLSVAISHLSGKKIVEGDAAWICGQLYCGRGEILRQIWLPTSLPIEDAFLYTMIVTDRLKSTETPQRVVLAGSASHVFEAYTNPNRLLCHEKWLILGNAINKIICNDLTANNHKNQDAGLIIKERNEQNSLWLDQLIQTSVSKKGWWFISPFILTRRFQSLLNYPFPKIILLLPLSAIAFLLDLMVSIQANLELHKGKKVGYWGKQTK